MTGGPPSSGSGLGRKAQAKRDHHVEKVTTGRVAKKKAVPGKALLSKLLGHHDDEEITETPTPTKVTRAKRAARRQIVDDTEDEQQEERLSNTNQTSVTLQGGDPHGSAEPRTPIDLVALKPEINLFLKKAGDNIPISRPCIKLHLSGDTNMDVFNTSIEAGHEDEVGRAIAGILYSRYHILEDTDIRELLAPGRLPSHGALYQIWRDRIKKWQYDFQSQIMAYFFDGVTSTCDHMGGAEVFDQTTTAGRMDLWEAIFDEAPVAIAQEMLGTVGKSVPLDDIFSLNSPEHKKWQRFYKTVFMFTAEDTYAHRYATLDDEKEEVFENWRSFPFSDECDTLDLGGVKDIPVKAGGPLDQGRRKAPRKITYPAGYRVATHPPHLLHRPLDPHPWNDYRALRRSPRNYNLVASIVARAGATANGVVLLNIQFELIRSYIILDSFFIIITGTVASAGIWWLSGLSLKNAEFEMFHRRLTGEMEESSS
ncbi:hypothetical protein G7Y79_00024g054860 [Physcia stellaris]|nr:hypothetical protein G7Y79_00024g054860 [Physcia stellaris]